MCTALLLQSQAKIKLLMQDAQLFDVLKFALFLLGTLYHTLSSSNNIVFLLFLLKLCPTFPTTKAVFDGGVMLWLHSDAVASLLNGYFFSLKQFRNLPKFSNRLLSQKLFLLAMYLSTIQCLLTDFLWKRFSLTASLFTVFLALKLTKAFLYRDEPFT